ncbi:MAG TPA: hypothetical protein VMM56_07500, partial [Planctomycetaceae bacterium]|nr:hypothetical protein [Planctomycetaceae bacterium]
WNQQSAKVRLFIDGKLDVEGTLRPKAPQPKQVVRLGFAAPNFPGPQSHFEGEIEYVKFYARELDPLDTTELPVAAWRFAALKEGHVPDELGKHSAVVVRGSESQRKPNHLLAGLLGDSAGASLKRDADRLLLELPATTETREFIVWFAAHERLDQQAAILHAMEPSVELNVSLNSLTRGGPALWNEIQETQPLIGDESGPFAADVLTCPTDNPWKAQIRPGGFDFFADGDTAAVCAWDGDVWKVTGIESLDGPLRWQRIAAGLFQPLGVKIVDGDIYVTCRDQIVILRDLNGDGETDFYENFNNDHQVTEHFHEFAMGLQRDDKGNFYYAKSARHALKAIVPHHGTLLRVSPDGSKTDIIATGFRAANGVCLNPDGSFIVTDQEGHWNPKNRINWVREGGFYGNMFGYHDVTDSSDEAMSHPLCWITNEFDRSPAELLWVPRDTWGPLGGSLLNLSYGYGKVYVVPHEEIDGQMQGGMIELPLPQFPTGLIRGRFHPESGQLYTCGMFAWAGNQQQPGGFYRIRQTGKPIYLPVRLHAKKSGVELSFTNPVDQQTALEPGNYGVRAWDLKRTANYGSKHFNEREWTVESVTVSDDGKTVFLKLPDIAPTWGMEIRYFLKTSDGKDFEGRIHNTIHHLSKE